MFFTFPLPRDNKTNWKGCRDAFSGVSHASLKPEWHLGTTPVTAKVAFLVRLTPGSPVITVPVAHEAMQSCTSIVPEGQHSFSVDSARPVISLKFEKNPVSH